MDKKSNIESREMAITAVSLLISSRGEALMIITSKVENPAGILSNFFFLYFIKLLYFQQVFFLALGIPRERKKDRSENCHSRRPKVAFLNLHLGTQVKAE